MMQLFSGRINRLTYIVGVVCALLLFTPGKSIYQAHIAELGAIEMLIYIGYLVLGVLSLSWTVRRGHDLGQSGWLVVLLLFIPILNIGVALLLLLKRGQGIENSHGSIPAKGINLYALIGAGGKQGKSESTQ